MRVGSAAISRNIFNEVRLPPQDVPPAALGDDTEAEAGPPSSSSGALHAAQSDHGGGDKASLAPSIVVAAPVGKVCS